MAVLQAFMDESGNTNSEDSVFVFAGFISTAAEWQRFTDQWVDSNLSKRLKGNKVLSKEQKGKPNDCKAISKMIKQYAIYRIECAVRIKSYERLAKGKVDKQIDSPYFWAMINAVERICRTVETLKYSGTVELFFDINEAQRKMEKWYDLARTLYMPQNYRQMLPVSINWKSDEDFLPLKASDFLAGLVRKDHNDDVQGLEHIVAEIGSIPIVPCSEPLDDAYFISVLSAPPVSPDLQDFERWKQRWNE